jgi:hypothetical protein
MLLNFDILIWASDEYIKDNISSKVFIKMSSIVLTYLHQPVMRIIDYFNYKILGLFDSAARVRDSTHWSPIAKLSYFLNFSAIETLKQEGYNEERLSFTDLKVEINNP